MCQRLLGGVSLVSQYFSRVDSRERDEKKAGKKDSVEI